MDLLQSFKDFIAKENLFSPGDKLLIAVSGGLDSVVLCELCHRTGYSFAIAHCNFQLRGEESERDEQFVRQLALNYGSELFLRRFDTQNYATENKVSVQVAARELRYTWFREIAEATTTDHPESSPRPNSALILTAHHLDDNIESLLMNFFRGTGIAGLHGILPKQEGLVRPLLFTGREELERFALEQRLNWVEDSSNQSDKYARNYLRHQVIPLVERIYPGALSNLGDNIGRFREIEMLYRQAVDKQKSKLMERKGEEIHIPVLKLKGSTPLHTIIYEIIREFGFSPGQVGDTIRLLDSGSGKILLSATHRILKNRNWLIISPLRSKTIANILIETPEENVVFEDGTISLTLLPAQDQPPSKIAASGVQPAKKAAGASQANRIALLDAATIRFPLLLRKWRQGDYFYPLGMRKKKKLGRFFIDNKLSKTDKEKGWVIEMDKKIIWVVGIRIDDRFRITPNTRQLLRIEIEPGLA